MPVMDGMAGHTLLTSASCQWQRKNNHDESLPLPQLDLTPNVRILVLVFYHVLFELTNQIVRFLNHLY